MPLINATKTLRIHLHQYEQKANAEVMSAINNIHLSLLLIYAQESIMLSSKIKWPKENTDNVITQQREHVKGGNHARDQSSVCKEVNHEAWNAMV